MEKNIPLVLQAETAPVQSEVSAKRATIDERVQALAIRMRAVLQSQNDIREKIAPKSRARSDNSEVLKKNGMSAPRTLLTPQEERTLLVEHYTLKRQLDSMDIREPETPSLLRKRARRQAIRDELVSRNIRLVAHVAKKFRWSRNSWGDLVNMGMLGLLEAIDRFELKHTTRLATYATWWIRQQLQIGVAGESDGQIGTLSPHHLRDIAAINHAMGELAEDHAVASNPEQIASITGMSVEYVKKLLSVRTKSYDGSFNGDEESHSTAITENGYVQGKNGALSGYDPTMQDVLQRDDVVNVHQMLKILEPRERAIIEMRFDLRQDSGRMSLREIGRKLRISKERVRQIQARAMRRLRETYAEFAEIDVHAGLDLQHDDEEPDDDPHDETNDAE